MSFSSIFKDFNHVLVEVLTAISPVLVIFLLFLLVYRLPKNMLLNLFKGVIFAFAGLSLFLQGVKVGFMPVGNEMGAILGELSNRWLLIPFGFLLGFLATLAEPAVRILCDQVEKTSSGSIRSNTILLTLCLAVGIFIALGMTRVVYGIPFYYIIIPGYSAAIILMFFSKPSFTAIAFDSGGVATGPMTVTFIMAMAVGAADAIEGRDAVIDGFGLIALVALAPIIMVMLLGFLYPDDNDPVDSDDQINDSKVEEEEKQDDFQSDQASPDPPAANESEEDPEEEILMLDNETDIPVGDESEENSDEIDS